MRFILFLTSQQVNHGGSITAKNNPCNPRDRVRHWSLSNATKVKKETKRGDLKHYWLTAWACSFPLASSGRHQDWSLFTLHPITSRLIQVGAFSFLNAFAAVANSKIINLFACGKKGRGGQERESACVHVGVWCISCFPLHIRCPCFLQP